MSAIIPQPKSVMSHEHLQQLFAAKYPEGSITLSSKVGGGKRRYSVVFQPDDKIYSYAGTAKAVADSLYLCQYWQIEYKQHNSGIQPCVSHWNKTELEQILSIINGDEWRNEKRQEALRWGGEYKLVEYRLVQV